MTVGHDPAVRQAKASGTPSVRIRAHSRRLLGHHGQHAPPGHPRRRRTARGLAAASAAPRRATRSPACSAPTATSATRSRSAARVAYPDHISPSGVGYDIGCGNKAVRTDLRADGRRAPTSPRSWTRSSSGSSFGVGPQERRAGRPPGARRDPRRRLRAAAPAARPGARKQLGTVGAGNHYVDLFDGDDGYAVGRRALRLARLRPQDGVGLPGARGRAGVRASARREGEMDAPPVLLRRRLRARAVLHRGDAAGGRLRLRGPRRRRRQGARDPRRRARPTRSTTTTTSPGASATSAPTSGSSARAARRRSRARRASSARRWASRR